MRKSPLSPLYKRGEHIYSPSEKGGIREILRTIALLCSAMFVIAGCAAHTPEIKSTRPLPEKWHEPLDNPSICSDKQATLTTGWWKGIADEEIDSLVKEVLAANPDIAMAKKRLAASQAAEKEVRSSLWPAIDFAVSFNRLRLSENSRTTASALPSGSQPAGGQVSGAPGKTVNIFRAQTQITYDLDLWGRNRHAVRSAAALSMAREAEVQSVALLVAGETVRAYLDLLLSNEAVRMDREIVDMQRRFLQLTEARQTAGIVTTLEFAEAKARLSEAEALLARAEKARALAAHRVAYLLDESPGSRSLSMKGILELPQPAPVPAGLPSAVVLSRPDVRASEALLRSSTETVGSLKAELLPSFPLIGIGGLESNDLSTWLKTASRTWLIGFSAFQTLFDAGARSARVEAAYAVAEEAMLSHRQTVLRALTEVEDSLVAVMRDRRERESMRDVTSARDLSLKATLAQSDAGITDEFRLLETKAQYLNARINSAISESNYRQSLLSLNLALGAPVNEK
jgi:NodT family efflux transporter outer membrane factor (OMF) lipoprotein